MYRSKSVRTNRLVLLSLAITGFAVGAYAQDLKQPVPGFSYACASESYNTFSVNFQWEPTQNVASDNEFILELSDENGDFSAPTTLASAGNKNTVYNFDFNFSFPQTVAGDNYKVRVRSTNPAKTSPLSVSFSAYYRGVNEALIVNNYQEASVCESSSITLTVDNYPDEQAYNWYKDMVLIEGEKGPSIEVSEGGIYFAEIDYGDYCSVSTSSNLVEVFTEASLGVELQGDTTIQLCDGEVYSLTANVNDPTYTYSWYKDGQLIAQTNQHIYTVNSSNTDFEGVYHLEVDRPDATCTEKTSEVTLTKAGFDLNITADQGNLLLPGESLTLSASTTASSPAYQWYRDGQVINNAASATLTVTTPGSYYVTVSDNSGCVAQKNSNTITIIDPVSYAVAIAAPAYTECSAGPVELTLETVEAFDADGTAVILDENQLNSLSYQWVQNSTELSGATQRNYQVNDRTDNGEYRLKVTVDAGTTVMSDPINIKLGITETPVLSASSSTYCQGGELVTITSSVTDTAYTYTWIKDGAPLSENGSSFDTNLTGSYQLKLALDGCEVISDPIEIMPFDESAVMLDVPELFSIPEGETKVVNASGAETYQWFDQNQNLITNGPSVTLTEAGNYTLKATIGSCEVYKSFTMEYQLSYAVPNVVTPNGDGFNDLWILPSSFAYQADITVSIFDENGVQIFATNQYQNNWPQAGNITYNGNRPPIYYYKINNGKQVLKQGTITVIK
ncbi:gliding motility-associated C-terminal domain-containing protein [Robertkochia aurantiaca]|uniref:T9SS type B sorting domain-containing protein n=1 Tax=Robertkochia aurantiaca TaxID=2873700 RepID=UPI001CC9E554|nr:gliding motility-associated C-terminal domain-containing protein [Robertkochia sp. 3YJGBD-33]